MKLKLSIEEPCTENWDKMVKESDSRFCRKCSKSVKDFTQMKEEEIFRYLKENKDGKICGRFYSEQLGIIEYNENINPQKTSVINNLTFFPAVALTSAALALSSCNTDQSHVDKNNLQDINTLNTDLDNSNKKLTDTSNSKYNLQKENKVKYDLENPNKYMLDRADSLARAENFKKKKDIIVKNNDTAEIVMGKYVLGGLRINEDTIEIENRIEISKENR